MYIYLYVVMLGILVGTVSFTIAVTSIFSSFREWVAKYNSKLEQLIFCPFCLSFYIALIAVYNSGIFIPLGGDKWYTKLNYIYSLIGTVFIVMGISGLLHYVLLRAYEPVMKNMVNRKIQQLRDKQQQREADLR